MRIVVTGGTGFVGQALVRTLTERGDHVVVLSRGAARGPLPERTELVVWTPERRGDWFSAIDGADAIVHLAGAPVMDERWSTARKRILRESRIRSTELVVDAIKAAARPPRVLVSGSAVGYYGVDCGNVTLDEGAPGGTDFLATLVRDWEDAAKRADGTLRVACPRIGVVLDRHGGALQKLLPAYQAYVGGPVGSGNQYLSWIHLRDTVRAIERAIDSDALSGPYNVTAPEPVTMNAFADALGKALGKPAAMRVPAFALKVALGESACVLLGGQRVVPTKLMGAGFAFLFPDLPSALADILRH